MKTKQSVGRRQKIVSEYPTSSWLCFQRYSPGGTAEVYFRALPLPLGLGPLTATVSPSHRREGVPLHLVGLEASRRDEPPSPRMLSSSRPPGGAPGRTERPPLPGRVGWLAAARREVAPRGAERLRAAPARAPLSGNRIQRAPGYAARLGLLPH